MTKMAAALSAADEYSYSDVRDISWDLAVKFIHRHSYYCGRDENAKLSSKNIYIFWKQ